MTLLTCSYRAWNEAMGVPIRTSVGAPRSFPTPLLKWPSVYPWGIDNLGLDEQTFRRRYRHQLHRKTPRILAELQEFEDGYCAPLVLLCFEPAREFCHRTLLAEWISQKLGVEVLELG